MKNKLLKLRIFASAAAVFMAMTCTKGGETLAQNNTVKEAFNEYIAQNLDNSDYPYGQPVFYDINQDGIEELIFEYAGGARGAAEIFAYKNNKVVRLKKFSSFSSIRKNPSDKSIIVIESSGASDFAMSTYKMRGKKLKKTDCYEVRTDMMGNPSFYRKNTSISGDEFSAYQSIIDGLEGIY